MLIEFLELVIFVQNLMMETCPPTNRSHEEDSKAFFLKVGKIVGVAKYSSKNRTNIKLRKLKILLIFLKVPLKFSFININVGVAEDDRN